MAGSIRTRVAQLLASHKRHARYLGVLSMVALLVAFGVEMGLRRIGITMTIETRVLDCPYDGNGAHTHDESCYDQAGELVCPLEERELHTHDDSCYAEERVLACGLEESEGHEHGEGCYDEEGNLACGLEESEGHAHTDACYETVRTLTCEKEEVTEAHVHGPGCFKTILIDDGETTEVSTAPVVSGEQTLTQDLKERDANGDEKLLASVMVKAPTGTLPSGAAVVITPLEDDQAQQAASDIEELLHRELGDNAKVKQVLTARIELVDAQGEKVAPNGNVQAKVWTDFVRDAQDLVVVHLVDKDDSQQLKPELMRDVQLVDWDENDQTPENENTLQFWMDRQAMALAIVEIETTTPSTEAVVAQPADSQPVEQQSADVQLVEVTLDFNSDDPSFEDGVDASPVAYPAQDFEGHTGNVAVAVSAPEGAFPADTTMKVEAVDTKDVKDAVSSAVPGLVDTVAAVDITFRDANGAEVQPTVPIQVTMTSDEALDEGLPIVLHVDDEGEASVVAQSAITSSSDEVNFDADTFPTFVMAVKKLQQTLTTSDGRTYEVSVTYTEEAGLPEDAELVVREVAETDSSFAQVFDRAKAAATSGYEGATVANARFFDISLVKDDATLEPLAPVEVNIVMTSGIGLSDATSVVHFVNSRKVEVVDAEAVAADGETETGLDVTFTTESFSVFGVVEMTLEKYVLASDGQTYRVTVTYGPEARVPKNAQLEVEEIASGSDVYADYVAQAENALGLFAGSATYVRLFDIKIVDRGGQKVEIAAPVSVSIELADHHSKGDEGISTRVVHFADGADVPDVVAGVAVDEDTVSFEAAGFSAYAIVQGPSPMELDWHKVSSIDELISKGAEGLYLGHPDGYYYGNTLVSDSKRTGIAKTKPAQSTPPIASAAKYYFELVEGTSNRVYAYCYAEDGTTKQYVYNGGNNSLSFTNESNKTAFTLGMVDGYFRLNNGDWYWNMQGGANGTRFCSYNAVNDVNNNIYAWYCDDVSDDPYDLDGKTYGLMNWAGGVAGKALMSSSSATGVLDAKSLTVMSTTNNSSQLFVPNDSDITMWTFQSVGQDKYYVKTGEKYLKIDTMGISLVDTEEAASQIQVVPGTGIHTGEVCLKSGNTTLTFSGTTEGGFSVGGSAGNEWLHFVDLSELTSDYMLTYSASKVSVSDESISNGSRVIVYTRSWNETKLKYDYYAIGPDGKVVPVYESGDSIEWVSGQLNTLLWNFVEYYWEGTDDPNYYYELYNEYSGKYLAPQVTGNQILSNAAIGINLNGRRDGKYYSTILAWDEADYSYVGLKVENGQIVTCPISEAMDFYFAVMQDLNIDDTLTTVPTVDHEQYGITMKIVDLENGKTSDLNAPMNAFLGNATSNGATTNQTSNLLSTNLEEESKYPTTTITTKSLSELFAKAEEVNHLFLQSTYDETGYFEFDSTQNFATLLDSDGNVTNAFTVYKELGTYDSGTSKPTLKHGQFFPFNDLKPGVFASLNGQNLYSATAALLPDSDPRKYEQLYLIEHDNAKTNTFFAVEIEASFTQTPNGLDAWGHDIIFEFTGDDDFWLYVDGELVIDLGGIHSAIPGSVNFRTGEVNVNGTWTTIRNLFIANRVARGMSQEDAEADVADLFEAKTDENGNPLIDSHQHPIYTFKDNTDHTMRIFYMERGAGASNLHMRFNLAAIKKGEVQLTKTLAGVDEANVLAEFPYQIWYKDGHGDEHLLTNAIAHSTQNKDYVFYKDSINPVKYEPSVSIGGEEYEHVFFLKPDETADISFPEDMTEYRIVECGVDTSVYSSVTATGNGESIVVDRADHGSRADFGITYAGTERNKVNYTNTVNPNALRTITITKMLYDETGENLIPADVDGTQFDFRLYLATEFDDLDLTYMHTYHVKDPDGVYCRWDAATQKFVPIEDIREYSQLSDAQKASASFTTSIYGKISKIASGYTVEVRDVLAGTKYRVEERPSEVPDGYSFQRYEEYDEPDNANEVIRDGIKGIDGTIVSGKNAPVVVRNLKGWGLRVNKVWTDKDYMSGRDTTYFAVYTKKQHGEGSEHGEGHGLLDYVPGTLRALPYGTTTLYWYWLTLPVPDVGFNDYVIREVEIKQGDPQINEDGEIINDDELHFQWIREKDPLVLSGTQKGETEPALLTYSVRYKQGEPSVESNVRIDTVINDRPGIILKKEDWGGEPLSDATFKLEDENGNLVGEFTSDDEGYITTAFLSENKNYILTETATPKGYRGVQEAITIRVDDDGVEVSGGEVGYYKFSPAVGDTLATLTIKNRPVTFKGIKIDGDTEVPLQGVEFNRYDVKTVGDITGPDLEHPTHVSTDEEGVIHDLDEMLPAGTYELREARTLEGYDLLPSNPALWFTISPTGAVALDHGPEGVTLTEEENGEKINYVLTIKNYKHKTVSFKKIDVANPTGPGLSGAVFNLYRVVNGERQLPALYEGLTSRADGMLKDSEGNTTFELLAGVYHLVETEAPTGYILKTEPVVITVTDEGVTYQEGSSLDSDGRGRTIQGGIYTLLISNTSGTELPMTGGPGTNVYTVTGMTLILVAACILVLRRRWE